MNELELKFELDGHAARKIRRHELLANASHQTQSQRSIYFDTAKGKVRKAGYSLRVRHEGDCFTQTVKTSGGSAGLFDRGEWEARVEEMAPDPKALDHTPLGRFKKLGRKVAPQVCSEVERTNWLIDRDGSVVEVVLDSGAVSAGGEETEFHELELELRAGKPAALFDCARELARAAPLHVGVLSKEQRGRMLAKGAFGQEHRASRVGLTKSMSAGQAFMLIVQECIRHFRLNEALIVAERDQRALHQSRVAIRRLRTALSLFRPAIRQGSLEPLRREIRALIDPFGTARNLDVFLDHHAGDLGWRGWWKLNSARTESYDRVIEILNSPQARHMLLDLVEWTASGGWQNDASSMPVGEFAQRRLDRLWKKVGRKGAKLGDLEEKQLHRLRIDIKKLRYAVEFFGPLYKRKRVRQFAGTLEDMQDCLGLVHDDVISRQIVADFALSEIGEGDAAGRARQLKASEKRFRKLKRAGRFWAS